MGRMSVGQTLCFLNAVAIANNEGNFPFIYEKAQDVFDFPDDSFPENSIQDLPHGCTDLKSVLRTSADVKAWNAFFNAAAACSIEDTGSFLKTIRKKSLEKAGSLLCTKYYTVISKRKKPNILVDSIMLEHRAEPWRIFQTLGKPFPPPDVSSARYS